MRPLYEMLETVRAYAALELAAAGERDEAMEGLVRYCTAEASLAAEGMVGPEQARNGSTASDDLENYRSALTWLIDRGRPAEACRHRVGLDVLLFIRGHLVEGLRWFEQILTLPVLPPATESRSLVGAGTMWYSQGELEVARANMTRLAGTAPTTSSDVSHDRAGSKICSGTSSSGRHLDAARLGLLAASMRSGRSGLRGALATP